jgi:hypothetical protein
MRFRQLALLGVLFLLVSSFPARTDNVAGQSTPVDIARNKIVEAFQLVQQADIAGAPSGVVSQLANNLNLALFYEQNATQLISTNPTRSGVYATLSLNVSSTTTVQALSAASAARTQTLLGQLGAYSLALAAAFGSTLLVMELHRLKDLVRKVRLRRVRLG